MNCICRSITLHSKLYMFSLLILIIVNVIVFILFYLQVEPVFLPACLNKAIQITSVSSISATACVLCNLTVSKLDSPAVGRSSNPGSGKILMSENLRLCTTVHLQLSLC